MLHSERLVLTRQVIAVKHQIRDLAAQLETLERRLAEVEQSESYLHQQDEQ